MVTETLEFFPSTRKPKAASVFKFLFCDRLVWTVDLTKEIKLRFQISPAWRHLQLIWTSTPKKTC